MSKVVPDLPFKVLLFFDRKAPAKILLMAVISREVCVSHEHTQALPKFWPSSSNLFPLGNVLVFQESCCRAGPPLLWG